VGVARALARHAPTVVLRPAVGATKALSNALLGVGNALDETSRRKIEDVSIPNPPCWLGDEY
jgi:autophagy-related protein 2